MHACMLVPVSLFFWRLYLTLPLAGQAEFRRVSSLELRRSGRFSEEERFSEERRKDAARNSLEGPRRVSAENSRRVSADMKRNSLECPTTVVRAPTGKPRGKCPRGHPLFQQAGEKAKTVTCSQCGVNVRWGFGAYSCDTCNYHRCDGCMAMDGKKEDRLKAKDHAKEDDESALVKRASCFSMLPCIPKLNKLPADDARPQEVMRPDASVQTFKNSDGPMPDQSDHLSGVAPIRPGGSDEGSSGRAQGPQTTQNDSAPHALRTDEVDVDVGPKR